MIKKLYWKSPEDIKILKDVLQKNKIVISSTDTVYGFLANVTKDSWKKISDLKEVKQKRPFLILVSSIDKISHFVQVSNIPQKTLQFVDTCWPGPVTFIFNAKPDLPEFLSSDDGTVALRCPDHRGLQNVLTHFNGLFSTSANKALDPAPTIFDEISHDLLEKIDYVVVDDVEKERCEASTLVDLSCPDYDKAFPFTVVRKGAFPENRLKEFYFRSPSII